MTEQAEKLRLSALAARKEGRLHDAKNDLLTAVDLCRESGDAGQLALTLAVLGQIERDFQNFQASAFHYEEAVAIMRKGDNPQKLAHTIRHLADVHRHMNHVNESDSCYREALEIYRNDERTLPLDLANALRGYAVLKQDAGELDMAKSLWQEAGQLYAQLNLEVGVTESTRRVAEIDERLAS